MKKLIIIFLFASCWDGEINGRKYKLHTPCIKSHTETYISHIWSGKSTIPIANSRTVCDFYGKTDTIWENKKQH